MQTWNENELSGCYRNKQEVTVAKLFILFFSIKMVSPLYSISTWTYGLGGASSFLFIVIGLVFILLKGRVLFPANQGSIVLKRFFIMYLICDITSIIMSLILYQEAGTIAGETTIIAASKKILFSIAYIVFIFYGSEVWKILKKGEISRIIELAIDFAIIIGLIQILVLYGVSPARSLYNIVNKLFNAWSAENIIYTKRIGLLTSEPANAASYITVFIIPFLLSKMLFNGITIKNVVRIVVCIVLVFFTKSTTGYVLLAVDGGSIIIMNMVFGDKKVKKRTVGILCIVFLMVTVLIVIIKSIGVSDTILKVMDKLLNSENGNSGDRKAMMSVNMNIFKEYPICGVGNGNQGFFYRELVSEIWVNTHTGAGAYNRAGNTLFDGGPFWLAFLSGYGIVGIVLLTSFIGYSMRTLLLNKDRAGEFFYFYLIALPVIFINGVASTLGGDYYIWFIFSLPIALPSMSSMDNA